jgi:hypothetical protein
MMMIMIMMMMTITILIIYYNSILYPNLVTASTIQAEILPSGRDSENTKRVFDS